MKTMSLPIENKNGQDRQPAERGIIGHIGPYTVREHSELTNETWLATMFNWFAPLVFEHKSFLDNSFFACLRMIGGPSAALFGNAKRFTQLARKFGGWAETAAAEAVGSYPLQDRKLTLVTDAEILDAAEEQAKADIAKFQAGRNVAGAAMAGGLA